MLFKNNFTFRFHILDNIFFNLLLSFIARLTLLYYGLWQDQAMAVKYTDVDYYVFTDAAKLITEVFFIDNSE